jgi:phage shock protein A
MSPLETQVREHQLQLRRRLDSVERIHSSSNELEERIGELEQQDEAITTQVLALTRAAGAIDGIAQEPDALPAAANA